MNPRWMMSDEERLVKVEKKRAIAARKRGSNKPSLHCLPDNITNR